MALNTIKQTSENFLIYLQDARPYACRLFFLLSIYRMPVHTPVIFFFIYLQDARPYACHLCEYSCKLKCNLGKHIKNVHKLDSTTSKSVTSVNTSDTHQEVELGSSDFPERRNDDYDLLLSISRHVGNEEGDMLSLPNSSEEPGFMSLPRPSKGTDVMCMTILPKSSEEPGFMSLPRTSKGTDVMSMTILPKSSEEHGFMSLPRTSKGADVMSMTKMTEHIMFSAQSEGSVDNLISKHMVQEGDKTFISI